MTEKATPSRRGIVIAVVLVVLIAAVFVIRSATRTRVDVRLATASRTDMTNVVSTNGIVEPVQDFQARATAPGTVARLNVHDGEFVQAGTLLIRMDDNDARSRVATARANLVAAELALTNMKQGGSADENLTVANDLAAARNQVTLATAAVQSAKALQARGSASAAEVAQNEQKLRDAQAHVAQLQSRRSGRYSGGDLSSQAAQVQQARAAYDAAVAALSNVDIRAPFSGTVYSLPFGEHDFVPAGDALLNMADLRHMQVRAYFDEPDVGKLQNGQPVKITWDAKPGVSWHGHITRVPTTIIQYSGTRHVGESLISVDDAGGDLLPNTNVIVAVTTAQKMNVLTVPREALHTDGARNYVFSLRDGKLAETTVQVGSVNLVHAEITGGLAEGQKVVLNAVHNDELANGMLAKAVN